jgi:DNA repair exonuclease SbcCD ATPase subunit
MPLTEEEKRSIIDLHFHQHKTIREVSNIMGKSSHDITPVTKEHRIRLAQNDTPIDKEQNDDAQAVHDRAIPNVQAYKLFSEGKTSLEVTAELNLPGPQVHQFYIEYLNLKRMDELVNVYREIKGSIRYFLKLFRLCKEEGLTAEQIIHLINIADNIHNLEQKFRQLQARVIKIELKRSVDIEQLQTLHDDIEAAADKLTWTDTACRKKYEELSEVCAQIRTLEKYIERFRKGQDYQELEKIVKERVGELLLNNKSYYKMCSLL